MDEGKDKELERVNVTESIVTVKTVVTTTETVIRTVVGGGEVGESREQLVVEEEDGGACEVGDVMVEVLGSDVFVDGVTRVGGDLGSDELGRGHVGFSAINDDGDGGGAEESAGCQDRVSGMREDDLGSCGEENVASELRHQCVGGDGNSLANSGTLDSEAPDFDKEKPVERDVEENIERKLGDAGGLGAGEGELAINGTEFDRDSRVDTVDVKSDDIESNALYSMSMSTIPSTAAGQMVVITEGSLEKVKGEDKAVNCAPIVLETRGREEDIEEEVDEQDDLETGAHGHETVCEDETVNRGMSSVEASSKDDHRTFLDSVQCSPDLSCVGPEIPDSDLQTQAAETDVSCETSQEKSVVDFVSRESEDAFPNMLDMHTQVTTTEFMDVSNESIPNLEPDMGEPDMGITDKKIKEKVQFVKDENFNDSAMAAGPGPENGALDEIKQVGTDMEIDSAGGIEIHSENQLVDMKERGTDIDNSRSKVSGEETWVVEMSFDAVNTGSETKDMVLEAAHDELKSNSEFEEFKAATLVKCKTETTISYDSSESSDPIEAAIIDKHYVGDDVKLRNIEENLYSGSSALEAEVSHISADGDLIADLRSWQDGNRPSEGYADQPPVLDKAGVIQEAECKSDVSRVGCMENHTTDRVAVIGLNMDDREEVQGAVPSEQPSVDNGSPYDIETARLLKPLTLDADGVSLVVPNTNIVQEVTDEDAIFLSASTNEEKAVESADPVIASMVDVAQVGLNIKPDEEIHESAILTDQVVSEDRPVVKHETAELSDLVTSDAEVYIQNGSNLDDIEEEQEEAAYMNEVNEEDQEEAPYMNEDIEDGQEEAAYMNNAASDEDETPEKLNPLPSGFEDSQGGTYIVDDAIEGPFIVETEDPGESFTRSAYLDADSGPTCDETRRSDADVVHDLPSSSPEPLVEGLEHEAADHGASDDSDMVDFQDEEDEAGSAEQVDSPEEQEVVEEPVSDSAKPQNKDEKNSKRACAKAESVLTDHRVSYQLPPESEGEFSVFDLVWGKVKSHPWWPGQIFHSSDSSEKAMKYFKKDCYFVAYFGDRTFAWNEASVLKPFRKHFSVAERQNKTEAFQNAVSCALAEVSRRTELGLACSCISEEAYDKIRYQMVENTGIREESSKRDGVDRCTGLDYFEPEKLVGYVRSLAVFPTCGVDRLELVIAQAQVLAFLRMKGIDSLAEYQYYEGISGQIEYEDSDTRVDSKTTLKGPNRKHNLKDIVYQRRREKSMNELMGESMYYLDGEFDSHEEDDNMLTSPTSGMKRKASGYDDFTSQQTTKTISVAKVSHTASSNPQQSFKVGECIQRVASQLTGPPSILKGSTEGGNNDYLGDGSEDALEAPNDSETEMSPSPSPQSSVDEMLSQLHLSAQDPMKGYSFLANIVMFFSEFRNLAVSTQRQQMRKGSSRKRKSSAPVAGPPESFEFDDRNDSYWTDMVVQNSAAAKPARRGRKRKEEQVMSVDADKPPQPKPRKSSRKQYFHGASVVETPLEDEKQQKQLPTELMLNFTGMGSIPTAVNLNKMFRCFGPLKDSDTEIDTQSSRARVVFKKRSDAEVAYSSAAMFNIFGSTVVNYQLNYEPSVSFKTSPFALTDDQEKAT